LKGVLIFIGIVIAGAIFCYWIPFKLLPANGVAMALPVITVPGERVCEDCFGVNGLTLTNTIIGTLLADVAVLLFAFGATRKLKNIPGRLQGIFELLTDALYSLARSTAGPHAKRVFPLMATIFLFLLFANWIELVPGVDSVGLMHCAEDGISGYPRNGSVLEVNKALDAGERANEANYEACHAKEEGHAEEAEPAVTEGETSEGTGGEDVGVPDEAAPEVAAQEGEEVRDDIYVVTSFVRAAATDLNLTLALGLLAVVAVEYFGVRVLGGRYFTKFINTPALENAGKNPMGIMDFGVGFLEIISELSRVISFAFRLFGNIFAGQVLLFVIPFLAGALLPLAVYGFELFVGVIQAFVFSMLLLVFSAMAMSGHEHDDTH
jgi:F-type H+-transporting ATPase subunit a